MTEELRPEDKPVPLDIRKTLLEFRAIRSDMFRLYYRLAEIEGALEAALGRKEVLKLLVHPSPQQQG